MGNPPADHYTCFLIRVLGESQRLVPCSINLMRRILLTITEAFILLGNADVCSEFRQLNEGKQKVIVLALDNLDRSVNLMRENQT